MATQLFLHTDTAPEADRVDALGIPYVNLVGSSVSRAMGHLDTARGSLTTTGGGTSVLGPTNGIEINSLCVSAPLSAQVTISGSITFNVWGYESSMSANAAMNVRIMKISGVNGSLTEVYKTARTTEMASSAGVNNWSETPGSSFVFNRGDRIVLIPFADDAGTMAASYNLYCAVGSPSAGVDGDTYVTFTETITFESAPAGTSVYLTGTSAGIDPGSATEYEAWTSRGGGVATAATSTATGPVSPIQITATGGGTAVEWYTKPLQAVTLAGAVLVNVRALISATSANATVRADLAVCATDGTGATTWAIGGAGTNIAAGTNRILLKTTEDNAQFWLDAPDVSITNGQRIRLRVYIDDSYGSGTGTMVTGGSVTVYYAGSAGATGDSYLTFPVTLAEYSAPGAVEMPYIGGGYYP